MAVIRVENLVKRFKDKAAVDDITFSVERGQSVGLLGPNGAGKTTAIDILLGLITRTSGNVRIFGLDPNSSRVQILGRCNFASAYIQLPRQLQVRQNLAVYGEIYQVKNHRKKANDLLELFEISHLATATNGKLSAGESTRVNLCKALLNDPELLLLDEPTASLDPDIADKVRKILRTVQKEKQMTMLYTSHNMRDVQEVCDQVLFMNRGKIMASGTPDEIVKQFNRESLEDVFIHIARNEEICS